MVFFKTSLLNLLRFHIIQSNSIPFLLSPYLPTLSLFHPPQKKRKQSHQASQQKQEQKTQ